MSGQLARRRRLLLLLGSAALTVLSGCATFGGNVKGSFSCAAPDGICAPSSSIDDRALAMIAGENGGGEVSPAGPYRENRPKARMSRTAVTGQIVPLERADPRRTQERVLRIVFQPYIDERGRLHEASAIHAVVQSGEWQQQVLASATPIPDRNATLTAVAPESLAEAIDRADPANIDGAAIDPDLPDPAVVAAARARSVDPVEAIKADVATRLVPKTGRNTPSVAPIASTQQPSITAMKGTAPQGAVPSDNPASAAIASKSTGVTPGSAAVVPRTTAGAEASSRVKASPHYQARATEIEDAARSATAAGVLPATKPDATPTVRAAGFPASVPEEN